MLLTDRSPLKISLELEEDMALEFILVISVNQ